MKFARPRVIWVLCLGWAGAGSGQALTESHEQFLCTSGAATRLVSIYRNASGRAWGSGGCRVDYTKGGETRTVWSSKNDYAYCTKRALALVTRLTQGSYSCRPETVEPPPENGSPQQAPAAR
jgi:hypothetical protein